MIANSGRDERGRYTGGKAGDQGGEWVVRPWYSRPWDMVLRADPVIGNKLAELARAAALNDNIGYDQGDRWSFLDALRAASWEVGMVNVKCEADCSSGVITLIMAVGHILDLPMLKHANVVCTYTGNMRHLSELGFEILKDTKYLLSDRYLLPGDVLLNVKSHTAINLDTGSAVKAEQIVTTRYSPDPKWVGNVTASVLNVRSGPGVEYACIKEWPHLLRGNWIDVCDVAFAGDAAIWYYVRIYGKYYGFVHSRYIEKVKL